MPGSISDAASPFTRRLLPGEKIIWAGRPKQGLMFTGRDVFLIPFSLIWGGFAIFWEAMALSIPKVPAAAVHKASVASAAPTMMGLFGIPFVLAGLFLIFGRFIFDAWVRASMFYALTDHRILIFRARPWASFQSVNLNRLPESTLNEGADGKGTIRFGPATSLFNNRSNGSFGAWIPVLDPTPQFIAIDDAANVFASIQNHAQSRGLIS